MARECTVEPDRLGVIDGNSKHICVFARGCSLWSTEETGAVGHRGAGLSKGRLGDAVGFGVEDKFNHGSNLGLNVVGCDRKDFR